MGFFYDQEECVFGVLTLKYFFCDQRDLSWSVKVQGPWEEEGVGRENTSGFIWRQEGYSRSFVCFVLLGIHNDSHIPTIARHLGYKGQEDRQNKQLSYTGEQGEQSEWSAQFSLVQG